MTKLKAERLRWLERQRKTNQFLDKEIGGQKRGAMEDQRTTTNARTTSSGSAPTAATHEMLQDDSASEKLGILYNVNCVTGSMTTSEMNALEHFDRSINEQNATEEEMEQNHQKIMLAYTENQNDIGNNATLMAYAQDENTTMTTNAHGSEINQRQPRANPRPRQPQPVVALEQQDRSINEETATTDICETTDHQDIMLEKCDTIRRSLRETEESTRRNWNSLEEKLERAASPKQQHAKDALERDLLKTALTDQDTIRKKYNTTTTGGSTAANPNPTAAAASTDRVSETTLTRARLSRPGAFAQRGINTASNPSGLNASHRTITISSVEQPVARSNSGLAQANPISERDLEVAEPMDDTSRNMDNAHRSEVSLAQRKTRSILAALLVGTLCLLVLAAVIVAILVSTKSSGTSSPQDVIASSEAPTAAPTLDLLLSLLPLSSQDIIAQQQMDSPQAMAYHWLKEDPNLQNYTEARKVQRYALATLYYATGGPDHWTNRGGPEPALVPLDGNTPSDRPPRPGGGGQGGGQGGGSRPGGGGGGGGGSRPGGGRPPPPQGGGGPPQGGGGAGQHPKSGPTLNQVNVTKEAWLDYDTDECDWFWTSTQPMCRDNTENIYVLSLVLNNLVGTVPPQLGLLSSIEKLGLFSNPQLGGTLPTPIGQLTDLQQLNLNSNRFHGTLPFQIGQLSDSLREFSIIDNQFVGSIPSQMWTSHSLTQIKVKRNFLTGTIPQNLNVNLPQLTTLELGVNQFSGTLPAATLGQGLQSLDVGANLMEGTLPTELGQLTNLHRLFLQDNQWSGTLPSELGRLSGVKMIWLHGNSGLTGSIPMQWGFLNDTLQDLNLEGSSGLTGTIPPALCGIRRLKFDCSSTLCGCDRCPCS